MKRLALTLTVATSLAWARAAFAYCPSYTVDSPSNTYNCGFAAVPGTNPSTSEWNQIFALVAGGPASWGTQGPSVGDLGAGCLNGPPQNVAASFPCEILKGIAMQESGWRQFCVPDTPADQVGKPSQTIISFDCGYGVVQVTSGMHTGDTASFDQNRVASDPTYNLATGTLILADKWKSTNCVGDNQPKVIEDWYEAAWAYNGLAYVNNPNNPAYDPGRGVWDPSVGGPAPYQEKVFGWIEFTQGLWTPTALAYPDPSAFGSGSVPPQIPDPGCASPTDCAATRAVHITACDGSAGGGGGNGAGGAKGAGGAGGATASHGHGATSSSTDGSGGGQGGDDATGGTSGCGCSLPGDEPSGLWTFWGALGAALMRRARRR